MRNIAMAVAEKDEHLIELKSQKEELETRKTDLENLREAKEQEISMIQAEIAANDLELGTISKNKSALYKLLLRNLAEIIVTVIITLASGLNSILYIALILTLLKTPKSINLLKNIGFKKEENLKRENRKSRQKVISLKHDKEGFESEIRRVVYNILDVEAEEKVTMDIRKYLLGLYTPEEVTVDILPVQIEVSNERSRIKK